MCNLINNLWYAIFVINGREKDILLQLNKKTPHLNYFIPTRILNERHNQTFVKVKRKLLPGYILMNGELTSSDCKTIEHITGVIRLLKDVDSRYPLAINEREMRVLNLLTDNNSKDIDISNVYKEGQTITVIDGPLFGLEGNIISVNARKGRAKVRMKFFGEERSIDLGINVLK